MASRIRRRVCGRVAVSLALLALAAPNTALAQTVQLRAGYGLSAVSTPDWTPVHGPSVGLELAPWDAWSMGVDFRIARRDFGQIAEYCSELCVEGPFDEVGSLRSYGLEVGRRVLGTTRLEMRSAFRLRIYEQWLDSTELATGREREREFFRDLGLGAAFEVRGRRDLAGFRPAGWAAYDRIFEGSCSSHGCWGSRNHVEVGLGLVYGR